MAYMIEERRIQWKEKRIRKRKIRLGRENTLRRIEFSYTHTHTHTPYSSWYKMLKEEWKQEPTETPLCYIPLLFLRWWSTIFPCTAIAASRAWQKIQITNPLHHNSCMQPQKRNVQVHYTEMEETVIFACNLTNEWLVTNLNTIQNTVII